MSKRTGGSIQRSISAYENIDVDHEDQVQQPFLNTSEPRRRRTRTMDETYYPVTPDPMSEPMSTRVFNRQLEYNNPRTLEEKKERMNSMFGFLPWKVC